MSNFSFFDLIGEAAPESFTFEKEGKKTDTKKPNKKAKNSVTAKKGNNTKAKSKAGSLKAIENISLKETITVYTGYYQPINFSKGDFSNKEEVSAAELITALPFAEFTAKLCKVVKLNAENAYIVFLDARKNNMNKDTTLTNSLEKPFRISLNEFEVELTQETITLELVQQAWNALHPDYERVSTFLYDEETRIIVPCMDPKLLAKREFPFELKVGEGQLVQITADYYTEVTTQEATSLNTSEIERFIRELYPELEGNFVYREVNDTLYVIPKVSLSKEPVVEKYPTDSTISLTFTRIKISPDDFEGKKEVTAEEILKFVEDDYPEFSSERTSVVYEKEKNMILLILQSSKKGAVLTSKEELEELKNTCEFFSARLKTSDERILRYAVMPVGSFVSDIEHKELLHFTYNFPKIPFQILNEAYHFCKLVNMIGEHSRGKSYEAAVQVYYDTEKEEYFLYYPKQYVSSGVALIERNHMLDQEYVLVMDIHSHHRLAPYFSHVDNEDEKGDRLYLVFGHIDSNHYEYSLRAGSGGNFRLLTARDHMAGVFPFEEMQRKVIPFNKADYPIENVYFR